MTVEEGGGIGLRIKGAAGGGILFEKRRKKADKGLG